MTTVLKIPLNIDRYEHIEDKSTYNYNFYRLHTAGYGCKLYFPILLEECHEDENYCEFSLGDFDEKGEFVEVLKWDGDFGQYVEDLFKK